jgi:uncharacterized integral membrane protein
MLVLAMSEATKTTLAYLAIWVVALPALVTGLIAVGLAQTYREWSENQANKRHRSG